MDALFVFLGVSWMHMGLWCSWVFHGCTNGFGVHGLFMGAHWALVLKKLVTMPCNVSLLQHHQAHLISIKYMVTDTNTPPLH